MTTIDPTSSLGKLRLFCGDYGDLPYLPDSVYTQALIDANDNLALAGKTCATYILGQLAFKVRRKMGLQLEVFASDAYKNYKDYLLTVVKDPYFSSPLSIAFIESESCPSEINSFIQDWKRNYYNGTQSQELALNADNSPNDGSRLGAYNIDGWILT